MLRVAHVLNSPGRGGVPRVVDALIRHTDPSRVSSHVFYLKPGQGRIGDLDTPCRAAASASKADAMMELVAFLDRHRIDILHTHSYRPNLYGRMAGAVLRPAGLRIVAHYHNDYDDKWDADTLCVERRLSSITDIGLAVSGAVAGHVAERIGLVCDVAENGIDHARVTGGSRAAGRAALGLGDTDQVVGLVGRVCRQKGTDIFVDAAIRFSRTKPGVRFVILGDIEDKALAARLAAEIEDAGLAKSIRLMGHREDMADMLAAIDLLAAPSRWEGFGLMLAEAMAAGVPVVASCVGGIPDVLAGAGVLVPPEDPAALAGAIEAILGDPPRRCSMIDLGHRCAARFDWARTAARVTQSYEQIRKAA